MSKKNRTMIGGVSPHLDATRSLQALKLTEPRLDQRLTGEQRLVRAAQALRAVIENVTVHDEDRRSLRDAYALVENLQALLLLDEQVVTLNEIMHQWERMDNSHALAEVRRRLTKKG